jgi:DNA replication protein DnaC
MAVCHRWLARNKPAKYVYVPLLLEELRAGFKEGADAFSSALSRYNTFLNVPLLFMDDLGTENDTPWAQEHLDTIINYRLIHKLPLIITTNLPLSDPKISFRIAHRLERGGKIIYIKAPKFEK